MFFSSRKKKNILLYQTSEPGPDAHSAFRLLSSFLFSKNFSTWKLGGMIFFVLLAGGAFAYGLFFSSEFQIKSVRVQGASADDAAIISATAQRIMQQKVLHIVSRNSYFLFPAEEMLSSFQAQFPKLSSIEILHPDPNDVVIFVAERSIVGIWCPSSASGGSGQVPPISQFDSGQTVATREFVLGSTKGSCAFFDRDGIIFEQAPDATSGHLLFVVRDARMQIMPPLGTRVLENSTYAFLQNLRSDLANAGRIPISFTIKNNQEVDANFVDGNHAWNVYFSTDYSAAYQIDVLGRLLSEKIGDKNFPYLDYVDLRVENKAYYFVHSAG